VTPTEEPAPPDIDLVVDASCAEGFVWVDVRNAGSADAPASLTQIAFVDTANGLIVVASDDATTTALAPNETWRENFALPDDDSWDHVNVRADANEAVPETNNANSIVVPRSACNEVT
jgi:hypothetical protein